MLWNWTGIHWKCSMSLKAFHKHVQHFFCFLSKNVEPTPIKRNQWSTLLLLLLLLFCYTSLSIFIFCYLLKSAFGSSPHCIMAKVLDCSLEVSKFKLQLCYYIYFWTKSPWGKGMNPPYPPGSGLNSTSTILLEGWIWD